MAGIKRNMQLDGMFEWGKAYASYLVAKTNSSCKYEPGIAFDNIDEMVTEKSSTVPAK